MKIVLKVFAGVFALVVIGVAALMVTFTASTLDLQPVDVGSLPPATPPEGMSLSALPTGWMESRAELAFRGGSWNDIRQFSMTAVLVRHPKGDLIVDAGFGKKIDDHVKTMPWLMQKFTNYGKTTSVVEQLTENGISTKGLTVILTHSHWDHVSGLEDLTGAAVLVDTAESAFISEKTNNTELLNSFGNINYKQYDFEGGPYLGFPKSHDVWGDGSVVVVPAPGHTPGSVVVFVNLPSGTRYALLGDLVWQMEGIEIPAERPWLLRRMIGEDDAAVRENIARVVSIHKKYPQIKILPAHDASAFSTLPIFPASAN